jgi:FHS family Na+ dependent glucose MFS transporter 1
MDEKLRKRSLYTTTSIYYLASICLGASAAVLGPTLQEMSRTTGSTLAQISSLFLLISFGYLLGSLTAGRIYDRVRGHPIISLVCFVLAAMLSMVPLSHNLIFLQILFLFLGIAQGSLDVGLNTLIVWLHGKHVPPFMNGLHASYGIGTTLAPLITVAVLGSTGSLKSIYWALAILVLPVALLVLIFHSPFHSQAKQQVDEKPAFSSPVFLTALVFFAFTGAELGFGGWIYTFTTSQAYGYPEMAASVNAAFWGALTIGRLVAIPLALKLKPVKILWVNFCGTIFSLLMLVFFSKYELFLWLATVGTGLFMASTFPSLLNDAQSRMHVSGKITGIFFTGSSLGSMALPWLIGQLIAPYGATATMIVVLGSMLLASGAFYLLNSRKDAVPIPRPSI